jgi:tRNA(His) 5'-end guanylyltransferase
LANNLHLEAPSHPAAAAAATVVATAQATDWVLLPSTYIVIRVDGKGFTK